jgi:hypothetical protein
MEPSKPTFAEAMHEAHTVLFGNLKELDEAVRPESGKRGAALGTCLEQVRAHLLEHFRFEEQGGYIAPVLREEPRFSSEIQELLAEHGRLARDLDALIHEARAPGTSQEVLRDRIRAWVKVLRHHESRENQLVQEAYYSAGATGD